MSWIEDELKNDSQFKAALGNLLRTAFPPATHYVLLIRDPEGANPIVARGPYPRAEAKTKLAELRRTYAADEDLMNIRVVAVPLEEE